jgi:hypothetical protein
MCIETGASIRVNNLQGLVKIVCRVPRLVLTSLTERGACLVFEN